MIRTCTIKNKTSVQSGLALSPADIERLTANGQSAALGSLESNSYYDNLPHGAEPAFENRRGVSINDIWNHSKDAQRKISAARTQHAIEQALKNQPNPELN